METPKEPDKEAVVFRIKEYRKELNRKESMAYGRLK